MAFGFGFNKQKVLSAAEKFVQQGKLQNAIAEYEKILKNDAKDLTVTNTVGDLNARLGETLKAVECFKAVGDAYATQGFTVKAIAMYKKIAKLQPSVDGSLKLAELYTQQGLFNDARAQYLQVAEDFMKNGELEQAVRLFQKVLEMDPENVPMRVKLAEVYIRLGKKKEAWEIFSAAAESLRSRGSLSAAEDILQRMSSLDPGNGYVLLLRGRAALESDDPKSAIVHLEKCSDLDSHPDGLRDLLKAYLLSGKPTQAAPIADKLLAVHNDPEGLFLVAEACSQSGQHLQALEIYDHNADRLMAADSSKLLSSLHTMIGHVRSDASALDTLLQLLNKAGESTHVGEVTELLAHACVKNGNLTRAHDLYQMLATMEPQNAIHTQNLNQVIARIQESSPSRKISAEEGGVIVEELEATAPVIDQSYPDEIAIAVRSALTDADLFLSYNLPDKAIVPLLGALPQAPNDVRLNQRLAGLHTRYRRFTEAAVCCRTLESVYSEAGYPDEAVRYGELATRYEESAGIAHPHAASSEPVHAAIWPGAGTVSPEAESAGSIETIEMIANQPPVAEVEAAAPAHPEFEVEHFHPTPVPAHEEPGAALQDVSEDLSAEWDSSLTVESAAPPVEAAKPAPSEPVSNDDNPEIAETLEEARFYLEHYMTEQAKTAYARLETLTKNPTILNPLRAQIDKAAAGEMVEPEPEISVAEPEEFVVDLDAAASAETEPEPVPEPAPAKRHAAPAAHVDLPAHADVHSKVEVPHREEEPQAVPVPEPEPEPAVAHAAAEPGALANLVADLEASLGDSFPTAEPAPEPPLPAWPKADKKKPAKKSHEHVAAVSPHAVVPPVSVPEPAVAHAEISTTAPPTAMPAIAASSSGAAAAPALSYGPAPVRPLGAGAQAMHPQAGVDLSEMFGELKQELEEETKVGDGDPETHYNLGVAFREMGLLDEAITELQKVCSAVEHGEHFSQLVQTYTWLAQCFLDKNVPEAAIRWYEKALGIPGLDPESRLAINYELGSASETANHKDAALRYFTQVYGANIDYRDVAERIQALKS